ncbi:MAG: IS21 family transposase [Candidatus Competibacteraceae bacterium]
MIRRDHYVEGYSIRHIARQRQVHRRVVRQALAAALPPPRKAVVREPWVLTRALRQIIDSWLAADREAPPKQRHTATRVYQRLVSEHGYTGATVTVRLYVSQQRRRSGLPAEAFVPQHYGPGQEAQVDWYEATVDFLVGRRTVQFFVRRACFRGREFHWACWRQTQPAFLEGHVAAFTSLGGVFARLRYDNLGLAVKKSLWGRRREETERFLARRSHYLFAADFCRPGLAGAHEKGGVEGTVGRFRRHHLVPVPVMADLAAFNDYLRGACEADGARRITGRDQAVAMDWQQAQRALRPLPATPFSTADVLTCRVDSSSRIRVRTNHYSVPVVLVEQTVEVQLHAQQREVFYRGRRVATHERLPGRFGERLLLDHYLELWQVKPGALANARALHQARESGQWPAQYDRLFAELKQRYGDTDGTRQLLQVLLLHRDHEAAAVHQAVAQALELGGGDAGAIAVLVRQQGADPVPPAVVADLGALARYGQTCPASLHVYDGLRPSQAVEVSHGGASGRA